jgi:hypothetical protein
MVCLAFMSNVVGPSCQTYTSHRPYGYPPLTLCPWQCTHRPMMWSTTLLPPLREMLASTWDKNINMCFPKPHSISFIDKSTSCSPKMEFAP